MGEVFGATLKEILAGAFFVGVGEDGLEVGDDIFPGAVSVLLKATGGTGLEVLDEFLSVLATLVGAGCNASAEKKSFFDRENVSVFFIGWGLNFECVLAPIEACRGLLDGIFDGVVDALGGISTSLKSFLPAVPAFGFIGGTGGGAFLYLARPAFGVLGRVVGGLDEVLEGGSV
jgi:hypothetical protein